MRARLAPLIPVALIFAAANPPLLTRATTENRQLAPTADSPAVGEIMRRALARAASQDEAKAELWFESLVTTTVESLDSDGQVTDTEAFLHRRYPFEGAVYDELIERNGEPLSESEARQEASRRTEFRRRAQEAAANDALVETNDERQIRFDAKLMARYEAALVGEEVMDGERCWVISFAPREGDLPQNTRIEKALNQSSGKLYISQEDHGVIHIDFTLLRPVRYVWGLVASLTQATGRLKFGRVERGVWLPSTFDLRLDARIFFRTSRRHIVRTWVERRRISSERVGTGQIGPPGP